MAAGVSAGDGFTLGAAQREWQNAAIDFARTALRYDMIAADRDESFSQRAGIIAPSSVCWACPYRRNTVASGLGLPDLLAVMEGLGYATRDQGLLFSINAHLWTNTIPLLVYGSEEQKRKVSAGLCSGEIIGANARQRT